MKRQMPALLIISGGSEVVSLALVEAAIRAAIPYAVFALTPHSLLRRAPGCIRFVDLSPWLTDIQRLRSIFLRALAALPRDDAQRLAILPTEDGSLRLLNELREDVLEFGEFSRARALRMGGIDKAEVAEYVEVVGGVEGIALTQVLYSPEQATQAFDSFGVDVIFKPALKPLDMDLSGMGGGGIKVVTRRTANERPERVIARLRQAWPMSSRWIAQPRLRAGANFERSVCAVRGTAVQACQVVERAKYPQLGGTAYWVSTDARVDLLPAATRLMETLDVLGISELSFLPDNAGQEYMIEFNPRPWLQIGLIERAGFSFVAEAVKALSGGQLSGCSSNIKEAHWLQLERALQAALSGQLSMREIMQIFPLTFRASTVLGGYSSGIPGAKVGMMARILRKLLAAN